MGKGSTNIEQIGPGSVLTGMVRSIQREAGALDTVE
jgi:malonyl CoA-acyl carrier protein transacylase